MKSKLTLTIIGHDTELQEFLKLCQYIQSFGTYGMNRTLHVTTDGDGSGRLRFVDETTNYEMPSIPLADLRRIEDTQGEYNVDIGE